MIPHRVRIRGALALFSLFAVVRPSPVFASEEALSRFGVNANPQSYTDSDYLEFCDRVIASNVKWVRIAPEWGGIETARGVHSGSRLAFLDAIVNRFHDAGVNILWNLCYTAPWASSRPAEAKPDRYKPADWGDWENYVTFITGRYRGKISHWEVWNEPDHENFWKDGVADYLTLLQKAQARIKLTDSANVVLMGGLAMASTPYGTGGFFDQLMTLGAGPYFDLVNYHAYGNMRAKYQGITEVMAAHSISSRAIWMTETGYSTSGDSGLEAEKAVRVDEARLYNETVGIERTFWYTFRNRVLPVSNPVQENFGLAALDLTPLPAFYHYQASDGAQSNFALQAAYPALAPSTLTLYHVPATTGDGSHVYASGNDRVIPATRYQYFRVNDLWLYDANGGVDDAVLLEITYLDTGTGSFAVHYDSLTNAYASVSVTRTNTGGWKTAAIPLAAVKFANRQNNAGDFRILAGATALTVRQVQVSKYYNPAIAVLKADDASKLLKHIVGTTGETENPVTTLRGVECRQITANNKYFYFKVSDAFAYAGDTHLAVRITFWDGGTDMIKLQYSAIGNVYKGAAIPKTNSLAWRTVTLTLTDAHFANLQNNAADFRIGNGGDDSAEYVSRVEVTLLP